tara:strand:- start:430 stop:627 length:198 start_codon:yes stop_codon:yes gene_type:complete
MINYTRCNEWNILHRNIVDAKQSIADGEGIYVVGLSLGLPSQFGAQEMAYIISDCGLNKTLGYED